ncbi:MAG: MarR family transcriptional regulator [Alcaligenaceae bacterium]|nr:MarR family transcriptional regulator [Alcaligenaceae bacterium]
MNLNLEDFLPYQINVLSETISQSIASAYESRHGLMRDDWRVLVAINQEKKMRATDIAHHANLDKMQVSRAIARLEEKQLLERTVDEQDKRNLIISVTPKGRSVYQDIAPSMIARNQFLLEGLEKTEQEQFKTILKSIQSRAEQLIRQD